MPQRTSISQPLARERRWAIAALCTVSVIHLFAAGAPARPIREDIAREPFQVDSGDHTLAEGDRPVAVFRQWIERPGVHWMQVHFGEMNLGEASYVELLSLGTGEVQRLDAAGMDEWSYSSAYFNGESVELTLFAAPGDEDVFVTVESITVPAPIYSNQDAVGTVASLCGGTDNRIGFSDSRVGRLGGCTGWLVSTGVALTAGHCTNDDGNITARLEFNVPASLSDGRVVRADLAHQYPVTQWTFQDAGHGDDFCVMRLGTSADGTGRRAHVEQSFFHMTTRVPAEDATMRVTGYGLDNTPAGAGGGNAACCDGNNDDQCEYNCNGDSQTQQTSTGRFDELSDDVLEYEVDTMPANSGSPVIRETTNLAVGIHTAGGCDDYWLGNENHGTYFGDSLLQSTLNDYLGGDTIFVDRVNVADFEFGQALYPARTVTMGVALVQDGGTVLIAAGSYTADAGNTFTAGTGNKAMTLTSNTGVVTIGN